MSGEPSTSERYLSSLWRSASPGSESPFLFALSSARLRFVFSSCRSSSSVDGRSAWCGERAVPPSAESSLGPPGGLAVQFRVLESVVGEPEELCVLVERLEVSIVRSASRKGSVQIDCLS